jgi:tRNA(Ile)-lysidine synthase
MLMDENGNSVSDGKPPETYAEAPLASQLPELEGRLAESWPVEEWRDSHLVLAVSGGADSVALLRAMAALKIRCGGTGTLFTAHLNHGLRGDETDADAAWLSTLCEQLGVPLEVAKADVASLAGQQGDGWEAAARAARYDFLRQTAERLGARFVAVAHTANDQVETVLQRIVRGTGLAGLAGIRKVRRLSGSVALVRPLLTVERRDIVAYLAALGQDYRTDFSNDDLRYTRNRLRHELLPSLREAFNTDVDGALLRLATQAGEAQQVVEVLAAGIARDCVVVEFEQAHCEPHRAKRVQIDCGPLAGEPAIIVREVCKVAWNDARWPLQAMGFDEWQSLAELANGKCAQKSVNLPEDIGARRERSLLVLEFRGLS